ncbi:MAG: ROK family protein [bacterium]|nr:ROK family protein [bacterium]
MNRTILALDVGGTFVKYGTFVEGQGLIESSVGQFPMAESGNAVQIVNTLGRFLREHPADLVSVSIPGPMDYAHGASLMKHKFVSLYGIPLDEALAPYLAGAPITFLHDGVSFLLGEMYDGNAAQFERPAGVMLGTGLGFITGENRRACINARDIPAFPLWNQPYRDGIAENYVSSMAMRDHYKRRTGVETDVKSISIAARAGDRDAQAVFEENGRCLGEMLRKKWELLHFDGVVIGGQIARSLDLMEAPMRENLPVPVTVAAHLSDAALRGAAFYALRGKDACTRTFSDEEIARVVG